MGVIRIVLARECTKDDIKDIMNEGVEIETFIHGAMCAGYSGRCVLSNLLTNRDANRGGCSQICRWDFTLKDGENNKIEGDAPFTFCSKDLSMLRYIPEMIDMGITSFKIEGRMRSAYYIATVVSIYRRVIDDYLKDPVNYQYNENMKQIYLDVLIVIRFLNFLMEIMIIHVAIIMVVWKFLIKIFRSSKRISRWIFNY